MNADETQPHDWRFTGLDTHNGDYWYRCSRCGEKDWLALSQKTAELPSDPCVPKAAPTPPSQQDDDKNPWHAAIDNELVCCHILNGSNHNDPRKALQDIINWHVQVALDPAVSSDAQKLIERGQQDDEALELLRRVANHLSEVGNHGDSFGWRNALKDARALLAKRGKK